MVEQIEVGLFSKVIGFMTRTPAELIERRRTGKNMFFAGLKRNSDGNYELIETSEVVDARSIGKIRKVSFEIGGARPSGEIRQVSFRNLSILMPLAVSGAMTEARYLEEGFDANAFYIAPNSIERTSESEGVQRYQPMRIPDEFYKGLLT